MTTASPTRHGPTLRHSPTLALSTGMLFFPSAVGAHQQADPLLGRLQEPFLHYGESVTNLADLNPDPSRLLARRFRILADRWRSETQLLSSSTAMAMHPAYQEIIGMGPAALPLILEDLRRNSGHWYWALKAISNEDPVVPADRGVIKKMKSAWLRWGETKGLVHA